MSDLLYAFSNITRVKIIVCLGQKEKNVTSIIQNCELSQSAVSQHLMKLRDAGIVKCERQGKEIIYSVTDKEITRIAEKIYKLILNQKKNEQSKRNKYK